MYVAGTTPAMIAQLMRMELGHVVNILSATKQIETAQRNADIAAAYRAGTKVVELARQYSLSHARVREILDEAGCVCRKRPSGEATKQRDAAMVEGFTSGATTDQLAKLHGITRCRVTQVLRAAGIRIKRGRPAKGGTDHVAE